MINEIKKCQYCQSEISKKSKICLICGKRQDKKIKYVLIGIAIIFVVGVIIGSINGKNLLKIAFINSTEEDSKNDNSLEESKKGTIAMNETETEKVKIEDIFYEKLITNFDEYKEKEIQTTIMVVSCVNLKDEYHISSSMDTNRNSLKVYTQDENDFEYGEYVTVKGQLQKEKDTYKLQNSFVVCSGNEAKNNWNKEYEEYIKYFSQNSEEVSYDNLMRYPDSYRGKAIILSFTVTEVEPDGIIFNGKIKAEMDGQKLLINDERENREPRLQQGDTVKAYAFGKGLATVEVKEGSGIFAKTIDTYNVPEISLRYFEIQ